MDDSDARQRIGQAPAATGKSYDETRAIIGPVCDEALAGWLKGIPRLSRRTAAVLADTAGVTVDQLMRTTL